MPRRLSNLAFRVRYDSPNSHSSVTFPGRALCPNQYLLELRRKVFQVVED